MGPTRSTWFGLGWKPMMGSVGLSFYNPTMVGWIEKPLNPTHAHSYQVRSCSL